MHISRVIFHESPFYACHLMIKETDSSVFPYNMHVLFLMMTF